MFKTHCADFARLGQEALVAGEIARRNARNLAAHLGIVGRAGDLLAIVETNAIERHHRPQVDVVSHASSAQPPELFEKEWRGHDRRAAVERKPVALHHARASPGVVQPLQHSHLVAARAEPYRGSKSTEAAANHDSMRLTAHGRSSDSIGQRLST